MRTLYYAPGQSRKGVVPRTLTVEMPLPYTKGMWETSASVEIELAAGRNELTFHGGRVAIDHFTLTPVR